VSYWWATGAVLVRVAGPWSLTPTAGLGATVVYNHGGLGATVVYNHGGLRATVVYTHGP